MCMQLQNEIKYTKQEQELIKQTKKKAVKTTTLYDNLGSCFMFVLSSIN